MQVIPPPPLRRSHTLWLSVEARYSACATDTRSQLALAWAVARSAPFDEAAVVARGKGPELMVPALTLPPSPRTSLSY
jgi:hypothetical protein